ncbi:MAG: twin-arginine translocase subunit TatC [Armatimonadetes bacterium]|nr:twin-arginine translocase subunit TatC [Armatimonadota bacterium]MBS1710473.1 twin-arginine translocase subunit TatC [Armatimonadota bacterium]MBX3108144.1 twin-arginine translocase subunit TatC [Fimbriimonadaceae bacterium]
MAQRLDQQDGRSSPEQPEELRLTLGEHLEELRVRLIRILVIVCIGMTAGWFLTPPVFDNINAMVKDSLPKDFPYKVVWSGLSDPFMFHLKMAFVIGAILTIPLSVMQLWGFVKPGLRPHERKPLQTVVPFSVGLFIMGSVLGYVILPMAFGWFASMATDFKDPVIYQNPVDIVMFSVKMVLAFGIGFQLPLIVFFLTRLGIISPEAITRYWRQAAVGVMTAAAIITPGGDIFSMLLMGIPLVVLTFGSIAAARLTMRSQDGANDVLNALD